MTRRKLFLLLLLVMAVLYQAAWFHARIIFPYYSISRFYGIEFADDDPLLVRSIRKRSGRLHISPPLAHQAGLKEGDRIVSLVNQRGHGGEIRNLRDIADVLGSISIGDRWRVQIQRSGVAEMLWIDMPPVPSPPENVRRLLIVQIALLGTIMIVSLFTGFFIGFMKSNDDNAFVGSLLFVGFATLSSFSIERTPPVLREILLFFFLTLNSFLVFLFLRFFLLFPSRSWIDRAFPWLKRLALWLTVLMWIVSVFEYVAQLISFDLYRVWAWLFVSSVDNYVFLAFFLLGMTSLVLNTFKSETRDERRRMVIILSGTAAGLLPLFVFIVVQQYRALPIWANFVVMASLTLFPLAFIYAVLKHRVMDIRLIIRRGIQYAMLSQGFLAVEGLILFVAIIGLIGPVFQRVHDYAGQTAFHVASFVVALGVVLGLRKLNRRVMPAIDRRFFRDAYNAQQILSGVSRAVRRMASEPMRLVEVVMRSISDSLYPGHVAVFLRGDGLAALALHGETRALAFPEHRASDRPYVCYRHAIRLSRQGDLQSTAETPDGSALPPGGALARYLDNAALKDPSPIDVNIESARPLTNALVKVGGAASLVDEEVALFRRLDTRLVVPLATHDQVIGFVSLGEKLSEEPYTREDKQLLDTLAEQTALALNYSKLVREVAEQEKLRREVEIAKEVQERLFPQRLPPLDTLDYTGRCRAARGVGGDYYDFIPLGDGRLGLALGDISGKGISAALLMAGLQATLRSCALAHGDGIDQLMADVNHRMVESSAPGKYATFFYGVYDDRRKTLTYVNAGHNPPVVFRSADALLTNGDSNAVLSEKPERLETGGIVVGMFEDVVYDVETIQLRQGDVLLLFTDGITEAVDAQENEFGEDRLFAVLRQNRRLFANDLCDAVFRSVDAFVGNAPQYDDMTIVAARVR